MTTTPAIIRSSIEARIAALVPTVHAGDLFRLHNHELTLPEWAVANAGSCTRRFSVRESGEIDPPDVTDGLTEGVWQNFTVLIAYPKSWRRGAGQLVDLDTAVSVDRLQIVRTVGTSGFASLATTTQAATVITVGEAREDLGPVVLGVVTLRAFYYRSLA